jgi:hypothetical protein
MTYAKFQAYFEESAERELAQYNAMPLQELLRQARSGKLGEYYQIWHSIAQRAVATEVTDFLLSFLSSSSSYLHRYHCASALISLNGLGASGWEAHHLSAEALHPVAQNLAEVRHQLSAG